MTNNNTNLSLDEIEDQLLSSSVSDEFLEMLKKASADNSEITEALYKYYLDSNNYNDAVYFLEQGAKLNDSYAQLYLASLYQQGKHCSKDEERSLALLEKSALNGEPEAQYALGTSLVLGAASSQEDIELGSYWLNESFLNGNDDSKMLLDSF